MVSRTPVLFMSLIILLAATIGCAQDTTGKTGQVTAPTKPKAAPVKPKADQAALGQDTVATVNGEIVSAQDFERRTAKKKFVLEAQGHNFSGATRAAAIRQLRETVINDLIQERVMLQEAAKEGIKISDQQVDTVLAEIRSAFPTEQAFQKIMASRGLNEEALKNYNRMKLSREALAAKHPGDLAALLEKCIQEAKVQVNEQVVETTLQSI